MLAYHHLDYLGDSVLRLLSYIYRPEDPNGFRWTRNSELAKIYDVIYGDRNPRDISKQMKDKRFLTQSKHGKASFVEQILGEYFLEGGLSYAKKVFERMIRLYEMAS